MSDNILHENLDSRKKLLSFHTKYIFVKGAKDNKLFIISFLEAETMGLVVCFIPIPQFLKVSRLHWTGRIICNTHYSAFIYVCLSI